MPSCGHIMLVVKTNILLFKPLACTFPSAALVGHYEKVCECPSPLFTSLDGQSKRKTKTKKKKTSQNYIYIYIYIYRKYLKKKKELLQYCATDYRVKENKPVFSAKTVIKSVCRFPSFWSLQFNHLSSSS